MKKKIALVTGGAGFLGSHLSELLLSEGYSVIAYDNLYSSSKENIKHLLGNKNFSFIKGDILNYKKLKSCVKKADIVFHLAAILGVSKIVENPLLTMSVNIKGVENVGKAALECGKVKVVFTSSSEAYGKSLNNPLREDGNLLFGPTNVARWNYGLSKATGEQILWAFSKQGLPVVITRLFNSYGPRGINNSYSHVIPKFIKLALSNLPLTVNQDGKQSRTFCFVNDTVNGIFKASKHPKNEVFNIGQTTETKIIDLAKKIIKLTGSKSKIEFVPEEKMYGKNFESVKRRIPDMHKSFVKLHFNPKTSLTLGITETVKWMKTRLSEN